MQNIRLTLQYSGTRYLGWQRPPKDGFEKTVSYKITSALRGITGEDIVLHAGAKTEPGIHAMAQTVSFQTGSDLAPEQFRRNLNQYLPHDIAVLDASAAPDRFRADLNARSRTYEYRICTAPVYDIFTYGYSAHLFPAPDIDMMKKAAAMLIGRHDFGCFSGVRKKKGTEKDLLDIRFETTGKTNASVSENGDSLTIILTASDFLYQMPLRLVSLLLEIGQGLRTLESIQDIFSGKERTVISCDAKGLILRSVQY